MERQTESSTGCSRCGNPLPPPTPPPTPPRGYSIACAKQKIRHNLLEHLQIEPSSQFGLDLSRGGVYTHHVLHYTFAHHYSAEGVPMIDSRHGEWHLDKREWQRSYPIAFPRPPTCARESAQTLYRMLHSAASSLPKWEAANHLPQPELAELRANTGMNHLEQLPPPPATPPDPYSPAPPPYTPPYPLLYPPSPTLLPPPRRAACAFGGRRGRGTRGNR